MLTGETILPTEFDDGKYSEIVMPETTKFVTREINGLPMLGIVKISQSIYYNYAISTEEKDGDYLPDLVYGADGGDVGGDSGKDYRDDSEV